MCYYAGRVRGSASHATITLLMLHCSMRDVLFVHALTCMTCVNTLHDSTQLDRFRVTARLTQPSCQMEPIVCDRDQDVCVTITMHIGGGYYWIGAGCDRHEHFQHIACENVRTLTRNVQLGIVHERRALQRVCVCTMDRCNGARRTHAPTLRLYHVILLCIAYFLNAASYVIAVS
uniref:Retrotransposon hot spot (RHS) protein n=1 Tax=Ascaris lumbricoides TaxID=6252 RepID=A0A0M3HRE4_ASCLU